MYNTYIVREKVREKLERENLSKLSLTFLFYRHPHHHYDRDRVLIDVMSLFMYLERK